MALISKVFHFRSYIFVVRKVVAGMVDFGWGEWVILGNALFKWRYF